MEDDGPAGPFHGGDDRCRVHRREGPQVDDLDAEPLRLDHVRGLAGHGDHGAPGDDGHVVPLPDGPGLAERHFERLLGDVLLFGPVEPGGLEEDDGIVAPQGGGEQALGVVGVRRDDDGQARDLAEEGLRALGVVLEGPDASAVRSPDDKGHGEAAPGPVPEAGDVGDDLVEGRVDEAHELDLDYGPEAKGGHADGDANAA